MLFLKVVFVLVASAALAFADSVTFHGPFPPNDGSVNGSHLDFDIQDAILAQPAAPGGDWTLTIHTNYGVGLTGQGENAVPDWRSYAVGDFLISWNGGFYRVVLHGHNGYSAGNLYQAGGYQTAREATGTPTYPDTTPPVWLDPGGVLLGGGTISSAMYGDGAIKAESVIVDVFHAPAGFLASGPFTVGFASATCGNGVLSGGGQFVPEADMLWLLVPGLLIAGRRLTRSA